MNDVSTDVRIGILIDEIRRPPVDGPISKVQALRDALLRMIERGSWRPGEKLPGERELAEYLSLSLGTVQAAMRSMASAGLIERRRGAGSFITDAHDLGVNVWHYRFLGSDGRSLMPFAIKVLSTEETDARGPWAEFLGNDPTFIKIRRVIEVGGEFKTYSEVYLEANRFRPLLDLPPEVLSGKNLRTFLHDRYNAPTLRAVHRITNKAIDEPPASLIGCAPGTIGIVMDALSYSYRDQPLSFQWIVIPPTDHPLEILG